MTNTTTPAAVEALKLAREYIAAARQALFDCHVEPATGKVDELGTIGLAEDDAILAAIDAALAQQPPAVQAKREPQWQAISTAPKDGTAIYVVIVDAKRPQAGVAHWNGEWCGGSAEDWEGAEDPLGHYGVYPSPTHWQPLPAPPIGAAGEGAEPDAATKEASQP